MAQLIHEVENDDGSLPECFFPINDLPDEVLVNIFSFLPIDDVCFSLPAVCDRWLFLSQQRGLWSFIKFICSKDLTFDQIIDILEHAKLLQTIILQWRTDTEEIIKVLKNNCQEVNKIFMVCCGRVSVYTIELLAQHYPSLEHLSLGKCWFVDGKCYEILCNFQNLKSLNISHSKNFDKNLFKKIINHCPFLQHINIDYIPGLSEDILVYLLHKRHEILLSFEMIGEQATDIFFSNLQKCRVLRKLHLSRCLLVTIKGLQCLTHLQTLRSLKLRHMKVSSEHLREFLSSKTVSNLEYLSVSHSENFDDGAASVLAENCKYLQQLDAVFCPKFTKQGQESIIACCTRLKTLRYANEEGLARTLSVGDEGIFVIEEDM